MFIDASAIVAILGREPGWEGLVHKLGTDDAALYISPVVRFEAVQALARKQTSPSVKPSAETLEGSRQILDAFIARLRIDEIPVSPQIGSLALDASMTYGKAIGHAADLNFGDCFAYACAKALDTPLVYKGNDFALTDLA